MSNTPPLFFEKNLGQDDQEILYSLTSKTFFTLFSENELYVGLPDKQETPDAPLSLQYFVLNFNPTASPKLDASHEISGRKHFIIDKKLPKGFVSLPLYQELTYQDIYPSIHLDFYLNDSKLKYSFIVKPGASVHSIKLTLRGQQNCQLDNQGNLHLKLTSRELILSAPKAFQRIQKKIHPIAVRYVLLDEKTVAFQTGTYDKNSLLILSPGIVRVLS